MPLAIGTRLGPYEVLGVIGAGGMGEVYRARDTNLQRDVAIKVLPSAMADNARRLLRFEREARTLAALNHPGIASVYGIEDASPAAGHGRAIVMELVDGEDLSSRLMRGSLSLVDALPIARQVAEALAAAHDAGIVHRDLKPANIKVRDDGTVKVLDFGLAKGTSTSTDSGSGSGSGAEAPDLSPTLTHDGAVTQDGVILGTAAYMAPEQALGKQVDKRADIWAFGVVLFEMLAGRRPFGIDATEPEWRALPAATPASIRRLLARCLTSDRKSRLRDLGDAGLEIDEALARPFGDAVAPPARWGRWTGRLVLAGLFGGVALGAAVWGVANDPLLALHARVDVGPAAEMTSGGIHPFVVLPLAGARTALAWSPNGRTLAFIGLTGGVRQVFLRDLGSDSARPLAGTEGARALTFSPNGGELAFWANDAINKVSLAGGPPSRLCEAGTANGIHWGSTRIVFGGAPSLYEVSPGGGDSRLLTRPPGLVRHGLPFLLPGDSALLYTEYQKQWSSGDERVMVLPLAPGAVPKVVLAHAADARYLTTGHLSFLRQGTLFVVPFDVASLEIRGEPVAVLKDVAQAVAAWDSDDLTLAGQIAISPQGMLAYVSGPLVSYPDRELVTIDRKGRVTPLGAPLRGYRNHVELSPDGTRLAVSIQSTTDVQLFAYDLARGNLSRMADSLQGEVILASWSPDDRIAVQVIDAGKITAAVVRPDAAAPPAHVPESTGFWAGSLSVDGRLIGMMRSDLSVFSLREKRASPIDLMSTTSIEAQPMWSPDGRWISYTSTTTGRSEVYIRPFPGTGDAIMVSTGGGSSPGWNPSGRELFYIESGVEQDRMMAVSVGTAGQPGNPAALFAFARGGLFLGTAVLTPYAVSRDGQRFYAVRQLARAVSPVTGIHLILNWFEELKGNAFTK